MHWNRPKETVMVGEDLFESVTNTVANQILDGDQDRSRCGPAIG